MNLCFDALACRRHDREGFALLPRNGKIHEDVVSIERDGKRLQNVYTRILYVWLSMQQIVLKRLRTSVSCIALSAGRTSSAAQAANLQPESCHVDTHATHGALSRIDISTSDHRAQPTSPKYAARRISHVSGGVAVIRCKIDARS